MLSHVKDIFNSFFGPNPALNLPEHLQSPMALDKIRGMGRNGTNFVNKMNELVAKDSKLLTNRNLKLFIECDKNFETVYQAFNLIYEKQRAFATQGTLESLVKMGPEALSYAQNCLHSYQDIQRLLPAPIELKEIRHINQLDLKSSAAIHEINRSEKDRENALYHPSNKKENHKPWVSKSLSLKKNKKKNIKLSFFGELVHRVELTKKEILLQEDIDKAQQYFYLSVADSFSYAVADYLNIDEIRHKNIKQREHLTKHLILDFIHQTVEIYRQDTIKPSYNSKWHRYIHLQTLGASYVQGFDLIEERVLSLISLLEPGLITKRTRHILEEIDNGCLFALKRALFLQDCAKAELEVMAQELKRALCPFDVLGRNPYPKYRVSLPNEKHQRAISIIPAIPQLHIASEEINFSNKIFFKSKDRANDDSQVLVFFYEPPASLAKTTTEQEMKYCDEIPGFGVATLFAKLLRDRDFRVDNLGINIDHSSEVPLVATSLDAGAAFFTHISPDSQPFFKDGREVLNCPKTESTNSYSFFASYYRGEKLPRCEEYLDDFSKLSAVKQENFTTAFNIAFLSPIVYELFMKQYMSQDNFWNSMYVWDNVLQQHLIKEQQALYNEFLNNPVFFNYFIQSNKPSNNIFHRYQQLVIQIEDFCFYKKHRFKDLPEFKDNPEIIQSCFLDFIAHKYTHGNASLKNKIKKAFDEWDTSNITTLKGIEKLAGIERGRQLKEKVALILQAEQTSPEPAIIFSSGSNVFDKVMNFVTQKK